MGRLTKVGSALVAVCWLLASCGNGDDEVACQQGAETTCPNGDLACGDGCGL